MNDLDQQRDGYLLPVALADASDLFDQYLISGEKDDLFIKRYVNSIN